MDPNQHQSEEDSPEHQRIGHTLENRYRIIEVLAAGGMGVVYRGERIGLNRPVAIKFLHANFAANPQARERFERELLAMSRLTHPNCVSVIDYGIADSPFIVMEFVTGRTLKDVLADEDRVQPTRALFIVNQILGALAHAHSQDMVHRDIKPANVVLASVEGVMDHVYVLDFGLAKFLSSAAKDQNELTASWMVLGTPAYMSPEQARAEIVGAATDIYATGVLLFELLTGTKPYYAENPIDTIQLHQTAPVPSIRDRLPEGDFSAELDQVVQTALAKDPARRFASATAFAEALDDVPEATPTLTSIRLRALTPVPRLRTEPTPSDTAAGGAGATAVMAGGRAGGDSSGSAPPPSTTVSLNNSDIQVVSSAPIVLPRPSHSATPAPEPERRAPAVETRDEEHVPATPSNTAARAPAAAAARSPRSGSRTARVVLASMLLAVAAVVGWYATRDEVPRSMPPTLQMVAGDTEKPDSPAPPTGKERPGDERPAPPGPTAPVPEQVAAALPDAASANAPEQVAGAIPDAGSAEATPDELAAGLTPGEGSEPATPDETAGDQPSTRPRADDKDVRDTRIKDVEQLVQKGRRDEAIRRIVQLRRTDFPRSGYLAYMLGNLYFQKQQWSNGLDAYEDALRLKPDYRSYATINENAIRAFSNNKTWAKARALFTGQIRGAGLKYLRQAAQSNKNSLVRNRAKQVISAINRR